MVSNRKGMRKKKSGNKEWGKTQYHTKTDSGDEKLAMRRTNIKELGKTTLQLWPGT